MNAVELKIVKYLAVDSRRILQEPRPGGLMI